LNPRAYIAELDQFEFPPPVDTLTMIWLPRLAVPTLEILSKTDPEKVSACARRVIEIFGPPIREKCVQEGVPQEDVRVAKKLVPSLGQLARLVGVEDAAVFIQLVLSIEDPKLFADIAPIIEAKGMPLLVLVWPDLLLRRDQLIGELADVLFNIDANLKTIAVFQGLPGVDPTSYAELEVKTGIATAIKTRRRLFRHFVANLNPEAAR
jgi:hypothetical protein